MLRDTIRSLPRVGPTASVALKRLGITTVRDLLFHFPFRYEDLRQVTRVADVRDGDYTTVRVRVVQVRGRHAFRRHDRHMRMVHVVEGLVADDSGHLRVVWFGQSYVAKNLAAGDEIFLAGRVRGDMVGVQMISPTYEKVSRGETIHTARVVPLYPLTDGVSQKQFRTMVRLALASAHEEQDFVPADVGEHAFADTAAALTAVHFPCDMNEAERARAYFNFREALVIQVARLRAARMRLATPARIIPFDAIATKKFVDALPFTLTVDQKKSAFAILKDMESARPMNRLLQGDVGSGKTVVAAIAAAAVAAVGAQTVVLAPTQLLAEQHAATFKKIFASSAVPIILKTATHKNKILAGGAIIIGTHALIANGVAFPQLGLVIVDEQHRFGVAQRRALKEKNMAVAAPHFLSMTATPIPRSLTLAWYGDVSVSRLETVPAGRKKILTRVVEEKNRARAAAFAREHIARGEQIFVVAPVIDPSDVFGVASATEVYERVHAHEFKDMRVGLLHGRMKSHERTAVMEAMRAGALDVLVATAIIEVGVDVPHATIMWIESADRFGLAQLHQFRGRVGRAAHQSYCFLFSGAHGERARERLQLMATHASGFVLAEKDLEMRGSGDVWGTVQSGFDELDRVRAIGVATWDAARATAEKIFSADENFTRPEHAALAARVVAWGAQTQRE